ncbi:MAG: FAD-dependent oxidoreductase [Deltaproteobacteria bacterium]|jgi:sarcosine oxidase
MFEDEIGVLTVQTFGHIGREAWKGPVWSEDGPLFLYGFPSIGAHAPKVGIHAPGPTIDPDDSHRTGRHDHAHEIVWLARRRFGTERPFVEEVRTCLYTTLPGEDFRIGRVNDGVFYASACSGHGFKTGPWVGRVLADLVDGGDPLREHARLRYDIG